MGSATYFGGNDAQEEGHWVWEDGSDFGYTNWAYNEPNGNTSENCLEVNTADGYWNDIACGGDHFIRYMCESPISKIINVFDFVQLKIFSIHRCMSNGMGVLRWSMLVPATWR